MHFNLLKSSESFLNKFPITYRIIILYINIALTSYLKVPLPPSCAWHSMIYAENNIVLYETLELYTYLNIVEVFVIVTQECDLMTK